MDKQIIISISREYGCGGHYIAKKISEELGILLLDNNILDHISDDKGMSLEKFKEYDESPKKPFVSRTVRGMSNSFEDNIAQLQFDYIKEKAESGASMIVVGHCADYILREYKQLINIFISADMNDKVNRIMEVRKMSKYEARKAIARHDYKRKTYHNNYADTKWGASRNYDLCINSSKLGLDKTAEFIMDYIKKMVE
ncbi:MAG: cytidylate kinase-like family protein [Lachnospiraceae bacterium]|nr:cytidylate kinase-like family protein [Lachnospiraceae bacterium]